VLEGFLFVRKGILPFLLLQFFGGWAHGVGSRVHVLHKTVEVLAGRMQSRDAFPGNENSTVF